MRVWTTDGRVHRFDGNYRIERFQDELRVYRVSTEGVGRFRVATFPLASVVRWDDV